MVGYAALVERTVNVMPIFAASCWITATIFGSTARTSATSSTFLQAAAVHMPLPVVSYFEPFIAAIAFETLPWSPGVPYGL